jgi:hypothetical protein
LSPEPATILDMSIQLSTTSLPNPRTTTGRNARTLGLASAGRQGDGRWTTVRVYLCARAFMHFCTRLHACVCVCLCVLVRVYMRV